MFSSKEELRDRIEAEQRKLQGRLAELKATARSTASDEMKRIKDRLDALKDTLADGWDALTEATADKLNDWLEEA